MYCSIYFLVCLYSVITMKSCSLGGGISDISDEYFLLDLSTKHVNSFSFTKYVPCLPDLKSRDCAILRAHVYSNTFEFVCLSVW